MSGVCRLLQEYVKEDVSVFQTEDELSRRPHCVIYRKNYHGNLAAVKRVPVTDKCEGEDLRKQMKHLNILKFIGREDKGPFR
jgi:hypothetical protein